MRVKAPLGHACLAPATGEGHLSQQQKTGGVLVCCRSHPRGWQPPPPLPWELTPALTCPLCCSPGCSRFGGVRSRIPPTPARASRTKRQQTARRTPSWRWLCSTASCSLREEKSVSPCLEQNCRAKLSSSVGPEPSGPACGPRAETSSCLYFVA